MSDNTEGQQAVLEQTREDLEALARWMGWNEMNSGNGWKASAPAFDWEDGALWQGNREWNPFTDANADVQVLQRAREVWPILSGYAVAIDNAIANVWFRRVHHLLMCYEVGDYARAVLAVVRAYPESAAPEPGR